MCSVQFSWHMSSQATTTERRRSEFRIGSCRKEVTTKCEEYFSLAVMHRPNCVDGIESVIARRFEIKFGSKLIKECCCRPLPNSHRAISLHIAMATHGT